MAPSWIIATNRHIIAKLVPDHATKRYELRSMPVSRPAEMKRPRKERCETGGWSIP